MLSQRYVLKCAGLAPHVGAGLGPQPHRDPFRYRRDSVRVRKIWTRDLARYQAAMATRVV